jgi:hypothetical protein
MPKLFTKARILGRHNRRDTAATGTNPRLRQLHLTDSYINSRFGVLNV